MTKIKRPILEGKKGFWGEEGWKRVNIFQYIILVMDERVTRIRWIKIRVVR